MVSHIGFNYEQRKYLPLREPDLSGFTVNEIQIIDDVLARLSDKTASEMRDYSHGDVPWITAEDGKPIDYESVFYRTPAYSVRNYGSYRIVGEDKGAAHPPLI